MFVCHNSNDQYFYSAYGEAFKYDDMLDRWALLIFLSTSSLKAVKHLDKGATMLPLKMRTYFSATIIALLTVAQLWRLFWESENAQNIFCFRYLLMVTFFAILAYVHRKAVHFDSAGKPHTTQFCIVFLLVM